MTDIFIVILGVIIILLIIYMYIKEQDVNKKFKILATRSDAINRQLFTLSKNLSKEIDNHKQRVQEEIRAVSEQNSFGDFSELETMKRALEQEFQRLNFEIENLKDRVLSLESGLKNLVLDRNSSVDKTDEIIRLYKLGNSIEDIARELHISRTEIEFALKLKKLL